MGLSAAKSLVIEDSENGLKSAIAAGVPTIVNLNSYTQNDDFAGAISVLGHLGDEGLSCQVLVGSPIKDDIVTVDHLKAFHVGE